MHHPDHTAAQVGQATERIGDGAETLGVEARGHGVDGESRRSSLASGGALDGGECRARVILALLLATSTWMRRRTITANRIADALYASRACRDRVAKTAVALDDDVVRFGLPKIMSRTNPPTTGSDSSCSTITEIRASVERQAAEAPRRFCETLRPRADVREQSCVAEVRLAVLGAQDILSVTIPGLAVVDNRHRPIPGGQQDSGRSGRRRARP
jgi:hypothetical protein